MRRSVCVLGAGVVGLTSALNLLKLGHEVCVVAQARGHLTCSANAGAIWGPFLSKEDHRVFNWSFVTLEVLRELSKYPDTGVEIIDGILAANYVTEIPEWFGLLNQKHDYVGGVPDGYLRCWRYTVPIIDMPKYLFWLECQITHFGGRFEERKVQNFEGLVSAYDYIVNCTGLGAKELCGDVELYPVKGQLVIVENPGVKQFFAERGDLCNLFYWMPQGDKVVIGGTAEVEFLHQGIDQFQVSRMLETAAAIDARFGSPKIVGTRVGFRPCRETVRLCRDDHYDRVFHNYGHGGSGVSISWGCAEDISKWIE